MRNNKKYQYYYYLPCRYMQMLYGKDVSNMEIDGNCYRQGAPNRGN